MAGWHMCLTDAHQEHDPHDLDPPEAVKQLPNAAELVAHLWPARRRAECAGRQPSSSLRTSCGPYPMQNRFRA